MVQDYTIPRDPGCKAAKLYLKTTCRPLTSADRGSRRGDENAVAVNLDSRSPQRGHRGRVHIRVKLGSDNNGGNISARYVADKSLSCSPASKQTA